MNDAMTFGKHRITKERLWYGSCGRCAHVVHSGLWALTRDLLEYHVRDHVNLDGPALTLDEAMASVTQ